ncbi:MAG TPA: ABC transporter permease [Phnomibacter sp.]|nr:ABC transporter permease [Phnomibacter sp.]
MKKLLEIEWMKIRHYKTFWILFGLFIVAVFGLNMIVFKLKQAIDDADPMLKALTGGPFSFPEVWKTVGWMTGWLLYFPGFIIIFLVTNEFTFRTHRQNIIDGLSRKQFVSVKLVMAGILAVICTIMMTIASLVFGFASGSSFELGNLQYIPYFFLTSYIYMLFAFTLALLFRKAALSVGIFFIYALIFDNLLAGYINNVNKSYLSPLGSYIAPLQVADDLFPIPFIGKVLPNRPELWVLLVIIGVWIVAYQYFAIRKFENEDL